MTTHTSWFNLQNSLNPFEPQQQSRGLFYRNNENSISYFGRQSSFQRQQQSRSVLNIQSIIDNFIGYSDNYCQDKQSQGSEEKNSLNQEKNANSFQIQSSCKSSESLQQINLLETKKGLKSLAKLLQRTLRKKRFDSSRYLTEQIQEILMRRKKLPKNEHARQSKNIRRRTYDALNVMIAANVLGPDLAFIKRVNAISFTKKCALIIGQKNQMQSKIIKLNQKLKYKRQFLESLKNKKQTLNWWISKQKQQQQRIKSENQQQLFSFNHFNSKNKKLAQKVNKITFPVIFIQEKKENLHKSIKLQNYNEVSIQYKKNQIKLFSQIDCFQILKKKSTMRNEYLNQTQQKYFFLNLSQDQKLCSKEILSNEFKSEIQM